MSGRAFPVPYERSRPGPRHAATASFNTLREDLTDLRGHVGSGFTEMHAKLDVTATGQQHIVELLERLVTDRDSD